MILRSLALGVAAYLAARRGSPTLTAVLVLSGIVLAVVSLISARAARALDRAAAAVGAGAASAISFAGVGAVDLFVGVPGRAISRLRGRSALTGGPIAPSSTWRTRVVTVGNHPPDRAWGTDVPGRAPRRRTGGPRLFRWVLAIGLFLVLDLVAGTLVPQPAVPPWVQRTQSVRGPAEPGVPGAPVASPAHRAQVAAFADAPWAADCLAEVAQLRYDYLPFIVRGLADATGSCVNVRNGVRAGVVTPGADLPEVWLLGGSAAFGEGQRDRHTISSELARQSAADGNPVQVVNLAVPGLTAYQEALLLEQLLAVRRAPDLVVLYSGMNDLAAQMASPTDQATWLPATIWRSTTPANTRSLWARWRNASLSAGVWSWLASARAEAAAPHAVPSADPAEIAGLTVSTYARGVNLARRVGDRHGVPVRAIFQATNAVENDNASRLLVAGLPDHVVDMSGALAGRGASTFIDSVHTNEQGARMVAAEIRRRLSDTVLSSEGP